MTVAAILLPLFVLVFLTFALGIRLAMGRVPLVRSGKVRPEEVALDGHGYPPKLQLVAASLRNQFELPVLFYVLTILAMATRKADLLFVLMAWIFVALRLVHVFIHTGSNDLGQRGTVWGLGALVLILMWIIFAVRILLGLE